MLDHTWFWFWTRMVAVSICWLIQLDSTAQFPNIYCMSKTCYQLINLYCQGEMSLLLSGFLWPCWHWLITCMCSTYLYWSEGLSHFLQTALSWLISAGSICGHWLVFGKMISLTSALQLFASHTDELRGGFHRSRGTECLQFARFGLPLAHVSGK